MKTSRSNLDIVDEVLKFIDERVKDEVRYARVVGIKGADLFKGAIDALTHVRSNVVNLKKEILLNIENENPDRPGQSSNR